MMSELPGDLLEEILCRVPTLSLKRFTCKRWERLFDNRGFTRKHFDKSPKQFMTLLLSKFGFYSMSINLHKSPIIDIEGEVNLIRPHLCLDQFRITRFCHSDGLLLCVCVNHEINFLNQDARLVVWNPCAGQTKWIQPKDPCTIGYTYALGSYKDKKSNDTNYKILSHKNFADDQEFVIYEINSNSFRILEVTLDCKLSCSNVSLKGNTYWFASDEKEEHLGVFLVSFDYTTERFGRLSLPYQYPRYQAMSLSVVREEKLVVSLQRENTEIWVTDKTGETNVVSWIKVLALDLKPGICIRESVSFLLDEAKKVVVFGEYDLHKGQHMVYIAGENNVVRRMVLGDQFYPFWLNSVPSLTQIEKVVGVKRKRGQ